MAYNLRNSDGDFFCYRVDGEFGYEWVPESVLTARGYTELIIFEESRHADKEIRIAQSPKVLSGMVRPDYPDMTGAYAAPETQAYLDYAEANFTKL